MPELAEVEFYRRRWDVGLGQPVTTVHCHAAARVFRGVDGRQFPAGVRGTRLLRSGAHGKQMLFEFSGGVWITLHLGMTGTLRADRPDLLPGRHDHLVLVQRRQSLVFNDPRQFGRVQFDDGKEPPRWWRERPPAVTSTRFTVARVSDILRRRSRAPIKAVLLMQEHFPGIGNWMADEILWRAGIAPNRPAGQLNAYEAKEVWRHVRAVSRTALRTIGANWGDPPGDWLFHQRWDGHGRCPRHGQPLRRETIGGRTTAWCRECQQ